MVGTRVALGGDTRAGCPRSGLLVLFVGGGLRGQDALAPGLLVLLLVGDTRAGCPRSGWLLVTVGLLVPGEFGDFYAGGPELGVGFGACCGVGCVGPVGDDACVVATSCLVLNDGAGAFVELPVGAQAGLVGGVWHVVHGGAQFVLRACHAPDACFAEVAVEHARAVVALAVGATEVEVEVAAVAELIVRCLVAEVDGGEVALAVGGGYALQFAIDVEADGLRGYIPCEGDVVPASGLQEFLLGSFGEFAEGGLSLKLLIGEVGVAYAHHEVLLDAHERRYLALEIIDADDALHSHG